MSDHIDTLLTRNLFEVFSEHDADRRRAVIKALFTEDVTFSEPHGHHVGHDALDLAVSVLHTRFPGFIFTVRGPAQALQDAGRLHWAFGPPREPPKITGVDFALVRDNKIMALYTFLDPT